MEPASDEHNSFDSSGSRDDVTFSSTCLASDSNGVLPNTPGVSQQTAELAQAASFISEIDDASQPSKEWKWEYIDDDTKIFRWILEKNKNQAIIQYLSEVSSSKSVVILVSDKQHVSEIADVLSGRGYPLVYCHEGCTSEQNAEAWDIFYSEESSILIVSCKSKALYSFYEEVADQETLLVDFPKLFEEYNDFYHLLDALPIALISEKDEHLLSELGDSLIYPSDPYPEWIQHKLDEISNKASVSHIGHKDTPLSDTSTPISDSTDVNHPKKCFSSLTQSRSTNSSGDCYSEVDSSISNISSLHEYCPDLLSHDDILPEDSQNIQQQDFPLLEMLEVPQHMDQVAVQHQQLAANFNSYEKAYNKQMEDIRQRKMKLKKEFEDNMHALQEWEQSINNFDKVVRARFSQETKYLRHFERTSTSNHMHSIESYLNGVNLGIYSR